MRHVTLAALAALLSGCGGAAAEPAAAAAPAETQEPAPQAASAAPADSADEEQPQPEAATPSDDVALTMPEACSQPDAEVCTPPGEFVEQACRRRSQGLALAMFRKGTPWQRAYLRRNTEAWYAGGVRSDPVKLDFGEEVIVLAKRSGNTGGIQVSGSGSADIYRWDGTCVSVQEDEISERFHGMPKTALLRWRDIDGDVRDALEKDQGIAFRNEYRRKACKKDATARHCLKARRLLTDVIAAYVRKGGEVPMPKLLVQK